MVATGGGYRGGVALAFIGYGAAQAWRHSQNRVEDWLPEQLPETQGLVRFFDRFGSDEFLMISWPGCVLGDQQADELQELLMQPQAGGEVYFAQAQTGTSILQSLMDNQRLSRAGSAGALVWCLRGSGCPSDMCRGLGV